MSASIVPEFRAEVRDYRSKGFTWQQIALLTGRPARACMRAFRPEPVKLPPPPAWVRSGPTLAERISTAEDLELAALPDVYPVLTLAGQMWHEPIRVSRAGCGRRFVETCDRCCWREECARAVARGDFLACERPLRKEML